mmetsp:Transcript_28343/g.60414  ORF Transcript_28343/g.60414 Transcript_28343/m.60414 type:complete len:575 (+) Transcript_28343:2-1726(+)
MDLDVAGDECGMGEGGGTQEDTDLPPQDNNNNDDENRNGSKETNKGGASTQQSASSSESNLQMPSPGEDDSSSSCDESESSSDSSSSSSSDDESESESDASDIQDVDSKTQLHQLQSEIRARQKLLTKLLRGREGTAYATMIQGQEELVNSQLLGMAKHNEPTAIMPLPSETMKSTITTPAAVAESHTANPVRTIKSMLLEEYHHTLPGAFSLLIHCLLYVTIYALIANCVNWSCDAVVIYLTGWDINENYFDSTNHERAFYAIVLILSLLAARITGVMYDWNENRVYQKRISFQLRNKWYMKCWDAKLANYFHGDALHEKYDNKGDSIGKEGTHHKRKRWGHRLKYTLDLFSFFICYKCVDYFVCSMGAVPMSDITQTVLDGLPSRQLLQTKQQQHDYHLGENNNGVSYACSGVVMSALDNPYSLDMLNWIATAEIESEEAKNWITNAKKCGWSGLAEGVEDNDITLEENDDTDSDSGHVDVEEAKNDTDSADSSTDDPDESNHPTFMTKGRIRSAHDDKYLQETISNEAYWELIGDPSPKFHDPAREMLFLLISTAICVGLLYAFGIPFLLI